jgi:basic membrane protein A
LKEGLRDPIKVYEYLNWFYVVEGNKRVSVLRYLEVDSFPAEVSRLVPKYDENNPDIRLYYAFLEFNKRSGINEIWFTREESFSEFWELIRAYNPPSKLMDYKERFKYFTNGVYRIFRKVFQEIGGEKLDISTGDALLDFMKINGVPDSYDEGTLRPMLKRFLIELESHSADGAVEVHTEPIIQTEKSTNLFTFFTQRPRSEVLKVGFAYANDNKTSSWAYSHELGRMHVENVLKGQVETYSVSGLPESMEAISKFRELIDLGCQVIFTTSPALINTTLRLAMEHPDITFMNCSGWHSFKHVNTYFGRIHEPRFLSGIVAAVASTSNLLGYIATFPVTDVLCGINAFTLGAQLVRPDIQVAVDWTLKWDTSKGISQAATDRLAAKGVEIISHHNTLANRNLSPEYGVYSIVAEADGHYVPDRYLAVPVWNWGILYEKVLRSILSGAMKLGADAAANNPNRNYWWGMDSGLLDFFYTKSLIPRETQKLIELVKSSIMSQSFSPFTGPILDTKGNVRIDESEVATHEQIMSMDWLVEGVIAEIPDMGIYKSVSELETGKMTPGI